MSGLQAALLTSIAISNVGIMINLGRIIELLEAMH